MAVIVRYKLWRIPLWSFSSFLFPFQIPPVLRAFSKSSVSVTDSVWTVRLTVEVDLRCQISPASGEQISQAEVANLLHATVCLQCQNHHAVRFQKDEEILRRKLTNSFAYAHLITAG